MKQAEKEKLLTDIWNYVYTKGMPIDVRQGINSAIADWVHDIVDDYAHVDTPAGIVAMADYNACPECKGSVGDKAKYCKHCGALLRE